MTKDLTQGKPIITIILMSLPIMLGNLFQQLYNIADTIIVGRLIGSNALAAVGSTASLTFMIMWFITGEASGFAILLAEHFGAGDTDKLRKDVCIALELSTAITLAVTILCLIWLKPFLIFMNTPGEILDNAYIYSFTIIAGMLTTMFYNINAAILRAMGDSKTPLYFLIISSVLNILLDVLFIAVFGLGVFGAALATVISQGASGILCFIYMCNHFTELKFLRSDWVFDVKHAASLLSYGLPAGLYAASTGIGILILQFAINCYGTNVIAGFTAAIKVQNFAEIPLNAFAVTMVNYEGQNHGAKRYDNMKNGFVQCSILGVITAFICGVLIYVLGDDFTSAFVDGGASPEVIDFAVRYLRITAYCFILYSVLLVTRSSLQGMGDKTTPVVNGIIESVFRCLATIYLMKNLSEQLLCLVNPTIWGIAALFLVIRYFIHWNRVIKPEIAELDM